MLSESVREGIYCFECGELKDFQTATELREHYFGEHKELVPLSWHAEMAQYRKTNLDKTISKFIIQ